MDMEIPPYKDLFAALERLNLKNRPVIAHSSLRTLRLNRERGAERMVDALVESVGALVVPTFTYRTMVAPAVGPPNNGMLYSGDLKWLADLRGQFQEEPLPGGPVQGARRLREPGADPRAQEEWFEIEPNDRYLEENRLTRDQIPALRYYRLLREQPQEMNIRLDHNEIAEPFRADMPADTLMGVLSEIVRQRREARRTAHPILSFAGINADAFLDAQTIFNPLGPIEALEKAGGWVLLMGVDHTANTSIHYGEQRAQRRQFTRWGRTQTRIVECPGFPGCSGGFEKIAPDVASITKVERFGDAILRAIPIKDLADAVVGRINMDPTALLCNNPNCPRCNAVRALPFAEKIQ